MHLQIEPPLSRWEPAPSHPEVGHRNELIEQLAANAHRLGTGSPTRTNHSMIATGHQAWLWHPGILAKDLALSHAAAQSGGGMFHIVVDQDVHEAMQLTVPLVHDGHLTTETLHLAPTLPGIPTGCQPAVDPTAIQRSLEDAHRRLGDRLVVDLDPITAAFTATDGRLTLAQQITTALARLRRVMLPALDPIPVLFVSQLTGMKGYQDLIDRLLSDARRCVQSYNQAVTAIPNAGITPMRVEPDRVELPLWLLRWRQPRQRVFADLAGDPPLLTLDDGQPIDPREPSAAGGSLADDPGASILAPRALLLTAVLRRWCCDLFIHGRGGDLYDRVTERWWQQWFGEPLAPTAVVSADMTLDLDVPQASRADLGRAVWWVHHLPHNIDRANPTRAADPDTVSRKRELIEHMDDDRDPARRATAYARINQINQKLARQAPGVISEAQQRLAQAQAGVMNRDLTMKRDWCFALYSRSQIQALADAVAQQAKR